MYSLVANCVSYINFFLVGLGTVKQMWYLKNLRNFKSFNCQEFGTIETWGRVSWSVVFFRQGSPISMMKLKWRYCNKATNSRDLYWTTCSPEYTIRETGSCTYRAPLFIGFVSSSSTLIITSRQHMVSDSTAFRRWLSDSSDCLRLSWNYIPLVHKQNINYFIFIHKYIFRTRTLTLRDIRHVFYHSATSLPNIITEGLP